MTGMGVAENDTNGMAVLCDAATQLVRTVPGRLQRLSVRAGDCAVEVEFGPESGALGTTAVTPVGPGSASPDLTVGESSDLAEQADSAVVVRAPLVGTFYAGPAPGAPAFVQIGDRIEAGQTIGIVEAMKLMNPVIAELDAMVTEIHVENAQSVEYDQPLLLLDPVES